MNHGLKIGAGQRSRFLALTKRSAASGEENEKEVEQMEDDAREERAKEEVKEMEDNGADLLSTQEDNTAHSQYIPTEREVLEQIPIHFVENETLKGYPRKTVSPP